MLKRQTILYFGQSLFRASSLASVPIRFPPLVSIEKMDYFILSPPFQLTFLNKFAVQTYGQSDQRTYKQFNTQIRAYNITFIHKNWLNQMMTICLVWVELNEETWLYM